MTLVEALELPDAEAMADLDIFIGRAKRVDPDGVARLVGHAKVLAVYVSPVHGAGGPTVLGLRTVFLADSADSAEFDVTVALAALSDRFARLTGEGRHAGDGFGSVLVPLPPMTSAAVPWTGMAAPRSGWEALGLIDAGLVRSRAADGVAEITAGLVPGAGAQAVARLRAGVWGRRLSPELAVALGTAYAADALGFVDDGEPAALYRLGPWSRLTTRSGHVLSRPAALT